MKAICVSLFAVLSLSAIAVQEFSPADDATVRYESWRKRNTEPRYGLSKVKLMVKKLKSRKNSDVEATIGISTKDKRKLSFNELFTYNMIYGEYHTQNCDASMPQKGDMERIRPQPPQGFGQDNYRSEDQRAWFKKNRAKVIPLIRSLMKSKRDAGSNVKTAIIDMRAYELVPDVISLYQRTPKDLDLLATLNCLMRDAEYAPFMKSESYQKLYSENRQYNASIQANKANRDLIVSRAQAFYKAKTKR